MTDSNFAAIDFPRFFGSDPGGSTVIPGIQNFALTTPIDGIVGRSMLAQDEGEYVTYGVVRI